MKFFERYFWAICAVVTVLGMLVPASGRPFAGMVTFFLAAILFFTGLKLDFAAALREFRRPGFLLYVSVMLLVVLPLGMWLLARWMVPAFATGVLILAAMPAGVVTSSLTDIARGNSALALVVTLATSVLCPLVVPVVTRLAVGNGSGGAAGGAEMLLGRAAYLAAILFVPLTCAYFVRRAAPAVVARHREGLTGMSIVCLALLILGAMSATSEQCLALIRRSPAQAAGLMVFLFGFSAVLHVAGYLLAPWRPPADRAALSITAAYVNNGLAIAFLAHYFHGSPVILPAILLEIPMTLAILPVKYYLARATRRRSPIRLAL